MKKLCKLNNKTFKLFLAFFIGALLLSFLSIFQKMMIGAPPFVLKGFLVPVLFGGVSGLFLGIWILKLKNAFKEMQLQKENLRITLNSIGDAVITVDSKGEITGMNPVAEKLTGWKIDDAKKVNFKKVFNIWDSKLNKVIHFDVKKIIKNKEIVNISDKVILKNKNREEFYIEDSAAPICSLEGVCSGVVIVFKDITEKYKMEELLRQKQKMEAIGSLAGGVAHDFNNMLAGILGFSELLLSRNENEKNKKYINMIIEIAERATALTKNLLSFARKSELIFKNYDLHLIIDHSIELLKRTVDKRIVFEKKFNAAQSIIKGDIAKLENSLINLGLNSRDVMPSGGNIIIKTETVYLDQFFCKVCTFDINPGNFIKVSFKDTGSGMKLEMQKKIFDPFFTTKEAGKGTGLGLAAVYGIIKEHKGAISVYSEEGVGTVFHIYLPLSDEKIIPEICNDEIVPKGTGTILICDDEEIIRNSGKEILTDLGYEVVLAVNGKDCLEIYKKNNGKIDLILLDMVMPQMNGNDCFYELKKLNPDVKIIICSGFTKDASVEDLNKAGLSGFLEKPFRRKDLGKIVYKTLN